MSRRRAYEDDDDDGYSRKRRRYSAEPKEIEDRLDSLIVRVGDKSTSSLESNLEGLAGVLEADLSNHKTKIMKKLCECVTRLPEKATIYTTLVGLLNVRNYNFGGEFVEMLVKCLRESLKSRKFEEARVTVRFLSDLVNCHVISAGSMINFLQTLADVSGETGIPQVRADFYVYTVLSALPWVGRELYEKKDNELDHLLRMIDDYISKRHKVHLPSLKVWQTNIPHVQEEYLDCLWAQINKLRSDKWVEHHILRPYLAFDGILCEALQHSIPAMVPPPHQDGCSYPFPSVVFRLFDYTDCPEGPVLPGAHSIERFLIEEQIRRVIQQHYTNRKDCAALLLSYPAKHKIPLEYVIVEVMLAELFKLPVVFYPEICLGSLFLELCKLQPSTMPQVLAQAVELMYERLDTMNIDCANRFAAWFAYHLSNFQFRWNWDDWNDCISLDPLHPRPVFIRETLQKCMRLSYHQRIVDLISEAFTNLLPLRPVTLYKYTQEGAESLPGTVASQQLLGALKDKCTAEEALLVIKDLPNPLQEDDVEPTHNPLKIDVFVQTLLNFADKSFSHAFAAVAKYHTVFKVLSTSEEAQICILRSMFELWHCNQQMMVGLVTKFLKAKVVECSAVANWLFSKEMATEFPKFYIWEILHLTIREMIRHVTKIQKQVEESKKKLQKDDAMEEDDEDDDDEDSNHVKPSEEMIEEMEEKLDTTQSELKNLFLIIFQRFIMLLTEHIARCEAEGIDFNNYWFKLTLGRLQGVFFQHHEQVFKYVDTLESLLFTSDIDHHILSIFQQFCALKA
ncbi:nuclear cap-binding protein subunit 1 [Caerostris darwini]|uniref:Nuclear cap-binding protein subunit 1 n=1 Tax=Caerostris darwini TaxID=1538125 RepID=A0AAV4SM49_9ARAC|nr:nuclear cap-binding protein subunit 1 [Caerostris darwini]